MRKLFFILLILIMLCAFSVNCSAAEKELFSEDLGKIESSIDKDTKNEMNSLGIDGVDDVISNGLDSVSIWEYLIRLFSTYSSGPMAALIMMTAVLLLASVAESYTFSLRYTETRDIMGVVVSLFLASIIVSPVTQLVTSSIKVMQGASSMMTVYLPIIAGIMAFSGHAISSGGYYAAVITVSQLISRLSTAVFAPLLNVFLSLSVCASVSSRVRLGGFIDMVSKCFKYGITFSMSVFTAVIGLNGVLSGAADSVANKAARFGLSSFIPLIGSSISEAYGALQNSVGVLRAGAGVFVIIAIFVSFAPIIIRSVMWSLAIGIAKGVGEMLSVSSAPPILTALAQFLSALRVMMIAVMTVFLITTSIMLSLGGQL